MKSLSKFPAVLSIECLKLKRTLALAMMVIAPLAVVILHALIAYFGAGNLARGGRDPWPQLANNAVGMWTILMMPLYVTLETSLLAGIEHSGANWKGALAQPVPRWMIYTAKLVVAIGLLWLAHVVLVSGMAGAGYLLKAIRPALNLQALPLAPLVTPLYAISAAALLGLAIQHWVSLRFQSNAAAIGFGMCAMVTGFVAVNSQEWGRRWPWSLPLHAVRPNTTTELDLVAIGVAGAIVVAVLGSWEFSRREIH